jgi:hypothetical protein
MSLIWCDCCMRGREGAHEGCGAPALLCHCRWTRRAQRAGLLDGRRLPRPLLTMCGLKGAALADKEVCLRRTSGPVSSSCNGAPARECDGRIALSWTARAGARQCHAGSRPRRPKALAVSQGGGMRPQGGRCAAGAAVDWALLLGHPGPHAPATRSQHRRTSWYRSPLHAHYFMPLLAARAVLIRVPSRDLVPGWECGQ